MTVSDVASSIGKGLVAGAAGTAAMTLSSTVEARVRRRAFSTAPADATAKVLGIESFASDRAYGRFSTIAHWGYGTAWGVVRGLLAAVGLSPARATAAHLAAVYGNEQVMLPALDVAPPFWLWGGKEVGIDAFHHAVYALGTGIAYQAIERRG
jgi:hypothetical protein